MTNHPRDAAEIERRHSNGRGLLHEDGASRANIVSGDAVHTLLTMSTVLDRDRPGRIGQDYFAYFANPYSVTRTILLAIADIAQELRFAAQQRRRDVRPRIHRDLQVRARARLGHRRPARPPGRGGDRATCTRAARSATRPSSPTTRWRTTRASSAPTRWRCCGGSTARSGGSPRPRRDAPRPYRFVVLSDHGQSQGATFLDRYGVSLEDLVHAGVRPADDVEARGRATPTRRSATSARR